MEAKCIWNFKEAYTYGEIFRGFFILYDISQ